MKKIHLLDDNLINKIAAGEVVERPSSVVKELLENSIDAGATSVTVEIKDGGISQIRITDNGKGIPREEIETAFMRHATSKLAEFDDLGNIMTLGFRGEALSSIASVSMVEVITKTADDDTGIRIELSGGKIISKSEIGCVEGTTFIMRNLFFNTPARRSFLKKPGTESGYVSEVINKIALGHPHISIKYINNNTVILHTQGNGNLKAAVFSVYGKETSQKMIELKLTKNDYILEGLAGRPELARANRSYGNFFINGRFIKSEIVASAAQDAYKGRLMIGKFPMYVINMKVPPDTVDVNVHPTKLEVRFSNDEEIYDMVFAAVSEALKKENLIPQAVLDMKKTNAGYDSVPAPIEYAAKKTLNEKPDLKKYEAVVLEEEFEEKKSAKAINIIDEIYGTEEKTLEKPSEAPPEKPAKKEPNSFFKSYKIIGQIFGTYWIIEQGTSLYLIDQHAAHERILYEQLMREFYNKSVTSQRLLQPIIVKLNEKEKQTLCDNKALLEGFGFDIELFGEHNTYAVRSVPYIFNSPAGTDYFMELIDILDSKNISNIYETRLDAIAVISCKAAVKANDRLNYIEAKALIEQIAALDNPFSCPHGRPTIIELSRLELEKKFKRVL